VMMSSGANDLNPRQKRLLTKIHLEREYYDRKPRRGVKPSDCLRAHLTVRREMIKKYLDEISLSLDTAQVEELAKNTRGLIEPDIRLYVDQYLQNGTFPSFPDHPTNTCDPFNGNWAEKLMNPYKLAEVLHLNGFDKVEVLPGYYGDFSNPIKRLLGQVLNILIFTFRKKGIVFSPFFSLYAVKRSK
ncbi:MAG TPA: hypothetical protein PLB05_05910, partial [Candidatus Omnitrophota bacterium]|nr:hypothetical protein [Candidatus Omnitrophota bacterium]